MSRFLNLHFHDEMPTQTITTTHIHDRHVVAIGFSLQFLRHVFDRFYGNGQRKKRIQQVNERTRMMMENLLERAIFSRIRHGCLLLKGPT